MTTIAHVSPSMNSAADVNSPTVIEDSTIMSIQEYCTLITKLEILGNNTEDSPVGNDTVSNGSSGQNKLLYQCLVCAEVFDDFNVILYDHIQKHCFTDLIEALRANCEAAAPFGTRGSVEENLKASDGLGVAMDLNLNSVDSIADENTTSTQRNLCLSEELSAGGAFGGIAPETVDNIESIIPSDDDTVILTASDTFKAAPFEEVVIIDPGESGTAFKIVSNSPTLPSPTIEALSTAEPQTSRERLIECNLCGKKFFTLVELKKHEYEHEFRREICGKVFIRRELLNAHKSLHTIDRPHECGLCSDVFRYPKQLREHMLNIHSTVIQYPCQVCGEIFQTKSDLYSHEKKHVNKVEYTDKYRCDLCQKSFTSRNGQNKHEKLHKIGIHPCMQCKERFFTLDDLNAHKNSRHQGTPYKCEMCPNAYNDLRYLRLHVVSTHRCSDDSYRCRTCGQMFDDKNEWQAHERWGHGRKRSILECHYCDRVFGGLHKVLQHEAKHRSNNDKPLKKSSGYQ